MFPWSFVSTRFEWTIFNLRCSKMHEICFNGYVLLRLTSCWLLRYYGYYFKLQYYGEKIKNILRAKGTARTPLQIRQIFKFPVSFQSQFMVCSCPLLAKLREYKRKTDDSYQWQKVFTVVSEQYTNSIERWIGPGMLWPLLGWTLMCWYSTK